MVGKSFLKLVLALLIFLAFQPIYIYASGHTYTLDPTNLPRTDANGTFTLRGADEWHIIDEEGNLDGNITLCDNTKLIIVNSDISINGTLWAKDYSSVYIKSSTIRFEVPPSGPVLVDRQYDNPYGFVMTDEETKTKIEHSSIYLHRADTSQNIPDNYIIPGEVLVSFGDFVVINSYINTNGTNDGSPCPPRGVVVHMDCEFNIINSTLTSGLKAYVNAHGKVENTTFKSLSLEKNTDYTEVIVTNSKMTSTVTIDMVSTVHLENCVLESALIVVKRGVATLKNTTINGLKMLENGTLIMDDSKFPVEEPDYKELNHIKENSNLTLLNFSYIKKVYAYDNCSISSIYSSMNSTLLYDDAFVFLQNTSVYNLSASGNSTVWLQNSEIDTYYLVNNSIISNVTDLAVSISLNRQPLQVPVELYDSTGNLLYSSETNEKGETEFTIIRDKISLNQTSGEMMYSPLVTSCSVEADYMNLHNEVSVVINDEYLEIELDFEDYTAPKIENVKFDIDPFLNTNEKVLVSALVVDEYTNLKQVILLYSTNEGNTWENVTMFSTGENVYENSIPGKSDGTKVRFYILAEDNCGNIAESQLYTYTVGEGVVMVNNLILITAFVVIIATIAAVTFRSIMNRNKEKKYIKRI